MKNAYFDFSGRFLYLASGDNQNVVHAGVIVVTVPEDTDVNAIYYDLDERRMRQREPIELAASRTVLAFDLGEAAIVTGATPGSILDVNGSIETVPDDGAVEIRPSGPGQIYVAPGHNRCGSAVFIRCATIAELQVAVRAERDARLAKSDWVDTLSAKARLGDATFDAWMTYRQALRDLPAEQPTATIDTVEWPRAPE